MLLSLGRVQLQNISKSTSLWGSMSTKCCQLLASWQAVQIPGCSEPQLVPQSSRCPSGTTGRAVSWVGGFFKDRKWDSGCNQGLRCGLDRVDVIRWRSVLTYLAGRRRKPWVFMLCSLDFRQGWGILNDKNGSLEAASLSPGKGNECLERLFRLWSVRHQDELRCSPCSICRGAAHTEHRSSIRLQPENPLLVRCFCHCHLHFLGVCLAGEAQEVSSFHRSGL